MMILLYLFVGFFACSLVMFAAMYAVGKKVCDHALKFKQTK